MGVCILCQVPRAKTPLRVDSVDVTLSSIEELCFFMDTELSLLDESFFSDRLADWLRDELGLTELAERLHTTIQSEYALADVILPIMDEIAYIRDEERQHLLQRIREQEQQPDVVRQKRRGDALAGRKKYLQAIEIYRKILSAPEKSGLGGQFLGAVCNNMGVAHAKLFQMEEATSCMRRAYELLHTEGARKNYLVCTRMQSGRAAYEQLAAELKLDALAKAALDKEFSAIRAADRPEDMDAALREWIREYRSTAGS